jgi:hypothetical protein
MRPVRSMTSDAAAWTAISSVTSSAKVSTPGNGAVPWGAREVPNTRNHPFASFTAMAAPIPEDTPVISATGGVDVIGTTSPNVIPIGLPDFSRPIGILQPTGWY